VLYLLWAGGTTVSGLPGPRALSVAIFGLGVGGCYTAKSHMETVYGVGGRTRPPLYYVVLASVLGGVTLVAGIVAFASGGSACWRRDCLHTAWQDCAWPERQPSMRTG